MPVTIYTPVVPCIKNNPGGYSYTIALLQYADPKLFYGNPPFEAADSKKTLDGVNGGNLTNPPVPVAGNTREVLVTLTQAETNANEISIMHHDVTAPPVWCDLKVVLRTVEAKSVGTSDLTLANITGSALFTGITSLANWLRGLARKDAMNAVAKLEVNAGGGTYDEATDSNQAIADAIPVIPATVTVSDITQAALAKFANTDTGEVAAVPGSVAELSQCNAAGFPAGSIEYTLTIVSPGAIPIEGASVWISTDVGMTNIIWRGVTDAFGVARDVNNQKPWLDAGLYQFWVQDENWTDSNPTPMVVS